jgi:hypothetical protein
MGLDMYLEARKFVSGYSFEPIDQQNAYENILASVDLSKADLSPEASPFIYLNINVAYWRKVNAVHSWFVENVQEGVDECQKAEVSREQLQELVDTCKQVRDDHSKAEELLPVGGGFFFGSYEYDEWYFDGIQNTIEQLEKILSNPKFEDWDFVYQSSW